MYFFWESLWLEVCVGWRGFTLYFYVRVGVAFVVGVFLGGGGRVSGVVVGELVGVAGFAEVFVGAGIGVGAGV